ncbi:MAG: 5-(carboxyamino)imidazole ribonucleotide mutase [Thermodesulfobacteriota bacterium]|nr:5-(carboxyamino)imidazole ribonucleotide mutase [Thermodesulfobacteriota bacterium]
MKTKNPLVAIVMGSGSDLPVMEEAAKALAEFQVPYEITVSSAHRAPERTAEYARKAAERGIEVIIAGAGAAAHLAGVMAAHTILPVIGVPLESALMGLDSLLSTAQMPAGVPVATVAIGKAGARNAGILAVQILSGKHEELKKALLSHKASLAAKVAEQADKIKTK